ncbi:hypothetical protein IWQ61_007694 [Dispira simplex]|nr:hypothetical protein IWQ61_007694 [Dispira simplex]
MSLNLAASLPTDMAIEPPSETLLAIISRSTEPDAVETFQNAEEKTDLTLELEPTTEVPTPDHTDVQVEDGEVEVANESVVVIPEHHRSSVDDASTHYSSLPGDLADSEPNFSVLYNGEPMTVADLVGVEPVATMAELETSEWWEYTLDDLMAVIKEAQGVSEHDLVMEFPQLDLILHEDSVHTQSTSLGELWRAYCCLCEEQDDAQELKLRFTMLVREEASVGGQLAYLQSLLGVPESVDDEQYGETGSASDHISEEANGVWETEEASEVTQYDVLPEGDIGDSLEQEYNVLDPAQQFTELDLTHHSSRDSVAPQADNEYAEGEEHFEDPPVTVETESWAEYTEPNDSWIEYDTVGGEGNVADDLAEAQTETETVVDNALNLTLQTKAPADESNLLEPSSAETIEHWDGTVINEDIAEVPPGEADDFMPQHLQLSVGITHDDDNISLLSYGDDQPLEAPDSINEGVDEFQAHDTIVHQPKDAILSNEEDATTKRDSSVAGLDDEGFHSDSSSKKTKCE